MKKSYLVLFSLVFIFLLIAISPVLFQEGNPAPILQGIIKLSFSDDNIIEISDSPKIYISKTSEGDLPILTLMERSGWDFDEQFGSGYMFIKNNSNLTVSCIQYTRKYRIWKFPV
ncbi:MAG TPA: hypothetical protein GXZ90_07480 [Clostridiales bacterium]|nr:hypothetical protein [Clostridiales bacterium]